MKKNNGFTLIELLAVIVVLAIIAIIATPIVLNIIRNANDSAAIRSAENILVAAKQSALMLQIKDTNEQVSGEYIVTENNKLCSSSNYQNSTCSVDEIELQIDGTKPISGNIDFEKYGSEFKLRARNLKLETGYYCNGYEDNLTCSKEESDYVTLTFTSEYDGSEYIAILNRETYKIIKGESVTLEDNTVLYDGKVIVSATQNENSTHIINGWNVDGDGKDSGETIQIDEDTTFESAYGGCVLKGTKISYSDGTVKNVEDVKPDDIILSYDSFEGKIVPKKVITVLEDSYNRSRVITLNLSNGSKLDIVDYEFVFDTDLKEYVEVTEYNYKDLVGKNIMINENGNISTAEIISTSLDIRETEHYTIYVEDNSNYIANNIITRLVTSWVNDIYVIGDDYKIDMENLNEQIDKYGVYSYDDVKDYISYELFEKLNLKLGKIIVGKKLIPEENLLISYTCLETEINNSLKRFKK